MIIQTQMSEEHAAAKDHGGGVGLIFTLDIETDMSTSWFEDGDITTHVCTWNNAWSTDQRGSDVGKDASVEVGHDHDIELLGSRNGLHRSVVDDHVVDFEGWVVLGHFLEGVAEETVGKFHNVGFVDTCHLLAVVGKGEAECEFGDTFGLGASDDLEGFDHAIDGLVLEARVFSFGILTDDAKVDVVMTGFVAGNVFNQDH